jgi:hypothetical protein
MKTEQELLTQIKTLTTSELRSLNRYYLHPRGQRACSDCHQIYDGIRENFHIKKHTSSGTSYNVKCKTCFGQINRARTIEYRKDASRFIASRLTSYACRARSENILFDLDAEYLIQLWNEQDGKCFYTEHPIDFTLLTQSRAHPHLFQPSLDKKDPALGYVKGNVVWTAYVINRMKNDLDYDDFIAACSLILSVHEKRT